MTDTEQRPKGASADADAAAGNVDKIREIIFGGQMRDYERRFGVLEERLLKESADLRTEISRRLDALEQFAKKELEVAHNRLKSEQQDRVDALKELTQELRTLGKQLDKRLNALDEQATAGDRELRQQILAQSKALSDEGRQRHQEVSQALERRAAQLEDAKTDRESLAEMLTELAMRLRGDFALPGGKE